jgi:hypothetical protein
MHIHKLQHNVVTRICKIKPRLYIGYVCCLCYTSLIYLNYDCLSNMLIYIGYIGTI